MGFRRITQPQQPAISSAANEAVSHPVIAPPPRRRSTPQDPPDAEPPTPSNAKPNAAAGAYAVGKNKPPLHTRWPKGRSGNPKGRPKGARNYDTVALEFLSERMPIRTASGEKMMDSVQLALNKLREKVGKGDMKAIDRTLHESRRLMPAPMIAPAAVDPVAQLSPAEQQILASLLDGQGFPPMTVGKPQYVEPDVAEAVAATEEMGREIEIDDEDFDDADADSSDDEEWEE